MDNNKLADLLEELSNMKGFNGYDCGGIFCLCGIDCVYGSGDEPHSDDCPVSRAMAAAKGLREPHARVVEVFIKDNDERVGRTVRIIIPDGGDIPDGLMYEAMFGGDPR